MVDFRSDTISRPTEAMLNAALDVDLGDMKRGEDPTVERLERRLAGSLGMESAAFLPSGTMGNQAACRVHGDRGEEMIVDSRSHVYNSEYAGVSALSGLQPRPIDGERGVPSPSEIRTATRINAKSETGLLVLENTHNWRGGLAIDPDRIAEAARAASEEGLAVHLDGARLFNAAVALDRPLEAFTSDVDSVMVSLSKGLAAPVGSVVAGSEQFVAAVRDVRDSFGGGMRQAGVLAAPALHALADVDRLATDHDRAQALAGGLADIDGITVREPETNLVFATVESPDSTAAELREALAADDVLVSELDDRTVRFCTHLDVDSDDVAATVTAAERIASEWS